MFSVALAIAFPADEALAVTPNGDDEFKPANAPKPLSGLFAFATAAANGEEVVWFANAPKPVAGFTKLDVESPELEPELVDGI